QNDVGIFQSIVYIRVFHAFQHLIGAISAFAEILECDDLLVFIHNIINDSYISTIVGFITDSLGQRIPDGYNIGFCIGKIVDCILKRIAYKIGNLLADGFIVLIFIVVFINVFIVAFVMVIFIRFFLFVGNRCISV